MNIKKGHMGSTIEFNSLLDRELFMKDFNSQSQMQEIFSSSKFTGTYYISEINFK